MTPIPQSISVVIPAYNEEKRLASTLSSVFQYLDARSDNFEIVVVDDGSHVSTPDLVETFAKQYPQVRLISYAPNKGKGFAVRTGMLSATKDLVLMNDADGATNIAEIERLLNALEQGAQIAIGSRAKKSDDGSTSVKAHLHRKYIGNTFNLIVQSLLLPGFADTQCGFKLFTRDVVQDIFAVSHLNGFAFDVEILYIARLRRYKTQEIPINWTNITGSKVNVFVDSPRMLVDVIGIAIGAWTGRYRKLK